MNSKLKNFYSKHSGQTEFVLPEDAKERVKERVFHRLSERPEQDDPQLSVWERIRASILMRSYVLVPLVVVMFIVSAGAVSAGAVPGDILYPIKRQVESARVILAPSADAKLELELQFAEERLLELERIEAVATVETPESSRMKSERKKAAQDARDNSISVAAGTEDEPGDEDSEHSRNAKRKVKARAEAEGALEYMVKARQQFVEQQKKADSEDKRRHDQDWEKKLEQRIDQYRDRLLKKDEPGRGDRGEVKGESDSTQKRIQEQVKPPAGGRSPIKINFPGL